MRLSPFILGRVTDALQFQYFIRGRRWNRGPKNSFRSFINDELVHQRTRIIALPHHSHNKAHSIVLKRSDVCKRVDFKSQLVEEVPTEKTSSVANLNFSRTVYAHQYIFPWFLITITHTLKGIRATFWKTIHRKNLPIFSSDTHF